MIRLASLILVMGFLVVACSGGDGEDQPEPAPSATRAATPRPGSTVPPLQTPETPPDLTSLNPTRQVKGLFRPPQPTAVTRVAELPERPQTPFAAWDGASVVVYDTETKEAHKFAAGNIWQPAFAPGHLVYTSEDRSVYVVDLATMKERYLAPGLVAYWLGESHIVINPGDNSFYVVRLDTGERLEMSELAQPLLRSMVENRWGGAYQAQWIDGRYEVRLVENPRARCEQTGVEQRICRAQASSRWIVEDVQTGETLYAIAAHKVEPAGPNEVVIATLPVCPEAGSVSDCSEVLARLEAQNPGGPPAAVAGTTNIFLMDLETGNATFVATASYNAVTGNWPMNWPLVANEQYIAWTESYCGDPRGATRIFDRATGEITELNISEWLMLSGGKLGLGEKGATAVIDAATLEYLAVLPELSGVSWSSDLRYAAVGQGFGRSSPCG